MSVDTIAEPNLAEEGPSSSASLRPDTRTSNSELCEGRPAASAAPEPPSAPHNQDRVSRVTALQEQASVAITQLKFAIISFDV